MDKAHKDNSLPDLISIWPDWKLNALMLDDTDLKIKNVIEKYKAERIAERRMVG